MLLPVLSYPGSGKEEERSSFSDRDHGVRPVPGEGASASGSGTGKKGRGSHGKGKGKQPVDGRNSGVSEGEKFQEGKSRQRSSSLQSSTSCAAVVEKGAVQNGNEEVGRKNYAQALRTMKKAVFAVQMALLDGVETEVQMHGAHALLTKAEYADVVTERSIDHRCGRPLCPNPLPVSSRSPGHYRISLKERKVYDQTLTSLFCSSQCLISSSIFSSMLPVERDVVVNKAELVRMVEIVRGTNVSASSRQQGPPGSLVIQEKQRRRLIEVIQSGPSGAVEGYVPRRSHVLLDPARSSGDSLKSSQDTGTSDVGGLGDCKGCMAEAEPGPSAPTESYVSQSSRVCDQVDPARSDSLEWSQDASTIGVGQLDSNNSCKVWAETMRDKPEVGHILGGDASVALGATPISTAGAKDLLACVESGSLDEEGGFGESTSSEWSSPESSGRVLAETPMMGKSDISVGTALTGIAASSAVTVSAVPAQGSASEVGAAFAKGTGQGTSRHQTDICAEALSGLSIEVRQTTSSDCSDTKPTTSTTSCLAPSIQQQATENASVEVENSPDTLRVEGVSSDDESGSDLDDDSYWETGDATMSLLDDPPDGFKQELSRFATMWGALDEWISAAAIAHVYGKEASEEHSFRVMNSREYPSRRVAADGKSTAIARTLSACLSRSLPDVAEALRLSVAVSTLERALGRFVQTMTFMRALPAFNRKEWRLLATLFLDALSVQRLPIISAQLVNNRASLRQIVESSSFSEAEYILFREVLLPAGRLPSFSTHCGA